MTFSKNLLVLRKKFNFTQEELAKKINVSKEIISEWENNKKYPEMDKLVLLCEIFNCSMDELVKGKIKEEKKSNNEFYNEFATMIALGVGTIILGLSVMLFAFEFLGESSIVPVSVFFVFVTIAVGVFVYYGISFSTYKKREKLIKCALEEEEGFNKKFALGITSGVVLILLGILVLIMLEGPFGRESSIPPAIFMFFVSISVFLFVYYGILYGKYHLKEENFSNDKVDKISNIIMLLATIIFLILGFTKNLWHPGWLVFPIGGILCAIVDILIGKD